MFGAGSGRQWSDLSQATCQGNEYLLSDCYWGGNPWSTSCGGDHSKDVGINCQGKVTNNAGELDSGILIAMIVNSADKSTKPTF